MKFGLPFDLNQYILWLLTPKALILLDIYVFFVKIFFCFVEQFIKPDTWYGSLIVVAVFGIKIPISVCFICARTRSQIYYTSAAFIVRVIYDILVIIPVCVLMYVIKLSHWAIIVIAAAILLIVNLLTCCCCLFDVYRYIDKYEWTKWKKD